MTFKKKILKSNEYFFSSFFFFGGGGGDEINKTSCTYGIVSSDCFYVVVIYHF
jgi:hypothetical protein